MSDVVFTDMLEHESPARLLYMVTADTQLVVLFLKHTKYMHPAESE